MPGWSSPGQRSRSNSKTFTITETKKTTKEDIEVATYEDRSSKAPDRESNINKSVLKSSEHDSVIEIPAEHKLSTMPASAELVPDPQDTRPPTEIIATVPEPEDLYLREYRILVCTDEGLIALYRMTEMVEIDPKTYLDKLVVTVDHLDSLTYFPRIARCIIRTDPLEAADPP